MNLPSYPGPSLSPVDRRVVALRGQSKVRTDQYTLGSGYMVAPGLVLTCRHVLENIEGSVKYRLANDHDWMPANRDVKVGDVDVNTWIQGLPGAFGHRDAPDVAFLRVDRCDLAGASIPPVRWGKLVPDLPVAPRVGYVQALGFPSVLVNQGALQVAKPYQMRGSQLSALEGVAEGGYVTEVGRSPAEPNQVRDGNVWQGMSGAAVFHDDLLVGVLAQDLSPERTKGDPNRLLVVPTGFLFESEGCAANYFASEFSLVQVLPKGWRSVERPLRRRSAVQDATFVDLTAGAETVRFTGRREELKSLLSWAKPDPDTAEPGPAVSMAIVRGTGGTGKTRIARELCHRLAEAGWAVGFLDCDANESVTFDALLNLLAGSMTNALVVVDYGAGQHAVVEKMMALPRRGRLCVLVIDRPDAFAVGNAWDHFNQPLTLGPIARHERIELFQSALEAFLAIIGAAPSPPPALEQPDLAEWLTQPAFENAILILIGARLVAAGDLKPGGTIEDAELFARALLREDERYWAPKLQALCEELELDTLAGLPFRSGNRPQWRCLRLRCMATAVLTGATGPRLRYLLRADPELRDDAPDLPASTANDLALLQSSVLGTWLDELAISVVDGGVLGPDPLREAIVRFSMNPGDWAAGERQFTYPTTMDQTCASWLTATSQVGLWDRLNEREMANARTLLHRIPTVAQALKFPESLGAEGPSAVELGLSNLRDTQRRPCETTAPGAQNALEGFVDKFRRDIEMPR